MGGGRTPPPFPVNHGKEKGGREEKPFYSDTLLREKKVYSLIHELTTRKFCRKFHNIGIFYESFPTLEHPWKKSQRENFHRIFGRFIFLSNTRKPWLRTDDILFYLILRRSLWRLIKLFFACIGNSDISMSGSKPSTACDFLSKSRWKQCQLELPNNKLLVWIFLATTKTGNTSFAFTVFPPSGTCSKATNSRINSKLPSFEFRKGPSVPPFPLPWFNCRVTLNFLQKTSKKKRKRIDCFCFVKE